MTLVYACFRLFVRIMLRLFYSKIRLEGVENVPKDVPLLVVPNHQNALIDPLLVGAFIPLNLHYLTRSDVFNKWTIPILKLFNMIPIYRIRDGYSKLSLNDSIFEQCKKVFKSNGSVLIFPEGNHGEEYYLRPLTKGAARLAIQSQQELARELMVLPVGLNFWKHKDPKSAVMIKFGVPFGVKKYLELYDANNAKGLISLKNEMSAAMKSTLLIPEETEDYKVRKNNLFSNSNLALSFDELKSIRPKLEKEQAISSKNHWIAKVLNPLPFLLIRRFIKRTDDVVFHATLKFTVGLIVFPLWWAFVLLCFSLTLGIKIGGLMVMVMISGLFYSYQR